MATQKWRIGDGLELLDELDKQSATLIILDLPYYGVVSDEWDNQWKNLDEYLDWCKDWFVKSERCLRDNGTLYYFNSQFKVIKAIDTLIEQSTKLKFRQFITIDKGLQSVAGRVSEALRSYPKASEYLSFYTFEDGTGLETIKFDVNNFSALRLYFKDFQEALGISKAEIVNIIGQTADHCFRWNSTQFDLPTKETYTELCKIPLKYEFVRKEYEDLRKEYEDLRKEYEDLRKEYEDLRYPFNSMSGFTDTWQFDFYKEKRYGHPTQKPFELIERIVLTSSNKEDLVIDPCMGTGTSFMFYKKHNRNFIGRELNPEYEPIIRRRLRIEESNVKPILNTTTL